jgi:D-alanyl-D-alanine carboxypeptidase (penicillin-binding protein 5/6)
LAIGD